MKTRSFLIALITVTLVVSCGSCRRRKVPTGPSPEQLREEKEAKEEKDRKDELTRYRQFAESHPEKINDIRRRINDFLQKWPGTFELDEANRLLRSAEEKFVSLCKEYHETRIMPRVSRYEEEEDFANALDTLERYDPTYLLPEIKSDIEERKKRYEKEIKADNDYYNARNKADERIRLGEFERALAIISTFIENPEYSGTMAAKRLEELIKVIEEKKHEAKEMAQEEEQGWEVVDKWDHAGMDEFWSISGDTLVAKNTSEGPVVAMAGDTTWGNYIVKFRFKLIRGEFFFGCRGGTVSNSDEWSFSRTQSPGADYEKGKWHEIRCEVLGPRLTWIRKDNLKAKIYEASRPKGPMAFLVLPDTEVHFKGIQVKHR